MGINVTRYVFDVVEQDDKFYLTKMRRKDGIDLYEIDPNEQEEIASKLKFSKRPPERKIQCQKS